MNQKNLMTKIMIKSLSTANMEIVSNFIDNITCNGFSCPKKLEKNNTYFGGDYTIRTTNNSIEVYSNYDITFITSKYVYVPAAIVATIEAKDIESEYKILSSILSAHIIEGHSLIRNPWGYEIYKQAYIKQL